MCSSDLTAVTRLAPQQRWHLLPEFLPDGNHFLYYVDGSPEVRGVYFGQLDGSEGRRLLEEDAAATSDRKSVVQGQRVSVPIAPGGRPSLKKQTTPISTHNTHPPT